LCLDRWRARGAAPDRATGRVAGERPVKSQYWLAGAALALTSSLALASPESLLPPIFDQPAPTPTPAPRQTAAPRPAPAPAPAPAPTQTDGPVVQPLPDAGAQDDADFPVTVPDRLPSLAE